MIRVWSTPTERMRVHNHNGVYEVLSWPSVLSSFLLSAHFSACQLHSPVLASPPSTWRASCSVLLIRVEGVAGVSAPWCCLSTALWWLHSPGPVTTSTTGKVRLTAQTQCTWIRISCINHSKCQLKCCIFWTYKVLNPLVSDWERSLCRSLL